MTRLRTFSPSMYKTFSQCSKRVEYSNVMHLCTVCFAGQTERNEKDQYVCKACGQTEVKGPHLLRGTDFDERITAFIAAGDLSDEAKAKLPPIVNKAAYETIIKLAEHPKDGKVRTQEKIFLDAEWNASPETGRTITLKLDLLYLDEAEGYAQILDWKTGSLTKKTNKLKSGALTPYIDQLETYALGVLAKYPKVNHVDTACYFLDADVPRSDGLAYDRNVNYQHKKEHWQKILHRVMSTEAFSPSNGWWCGWCPYRKEAGGPCVF